MFSLASATACFLTLTLAFADAICESLASEPSASSLALAYVASALARLAWAALRSAVSWRVSIVASTSPSLTVSPAATLTAVTLPVALKVKVSLFAAARVPVPSTDFSMVSRLAAVVWVLVASVGSPVAAVDASPCHAVHPSPSATPAITQTGGSTHVRKNFQFRTRFAITVSRCRTTYVVYDGRWRICEVAVSVLRGS